jgi:tetratricopeptide (TPR) repeat protein
VAEPHKPRSLSVQRSDAAVEEVLALLPPLDDLEVLRLRLISYAQPDPRRTWDSSSAFATVDKRILSPDEIDRALDDAEAALREYVASLHQGLRPVLRSFFESDFDAAARHLVALGEQHEEMGRVRSAHQCYGAALRVSLPLAEKGAQVLALRRVGRISLALGEFQEAASHYERSAELARDSADLHGEVIARTGRANVYFWQGRWPEAEAACRAVLALTDTAPKGTLELERGYLFNNLANVSTRLERIADAEEWFERALAIWNVHSSPQDLAVCLHNLAHLRALQGRTDEASTIYERAFQLPITPTLRVAIAVDIAELRLKQGHVTQAEEWAHVAEEHAIAAASPYLLVRFYHSRGNIARSRGDADGFTLYEKALEIARAKGYTYLEAETLADYAELRLQTGGVEEAQAYLERACEMFAELGAVKDQARAEEALARLASPSPASVGD